MADILRLLCQDQAFLSPMIFAPREMAMEQNKRKLPAKVAAMKARKRQRLGGPVGEKDVASVASAPKNGSTVRPDQMHWTQVEMPDKLDDFEGFYGLEEIDDVDVIRDASTGIVSYKSVTKPAKQSSNSSGNKKSAKAVLDGVRTQGGTSDDEFEGFGDDDDSKTDKVVPNGILKKPAVTKTAKAAATKKPKPASKAQSNGDTAAFETFDNEVTEETVDTSAWRALNLSPDTLAGLSRLTFSSPTPIQSASIPEIMAGHDVIGKATTGSGKTLAFGIPIFETFLETRHERRSTDSTSAPLALILAPTRELAHQLDGHLSELCKGMPGRPPSIATLTGGLSLQKQQRQLKTADIVIGTPGRLWDVISTGQGVAASIKQIRYLVIDEADRMLSQGHFKELEEILNVLDQGEVTNEGDGEDADEADEAPPSSVERPPRQTLVFSATFHKGLQQRLSGKGKPHSAVMDKKESMEYLISRLKFHEEKPKFVDANPTSQMASGLKEGLVECAGTEKVSHRHCSCRAHRCKARLILRS